MPTHPHRGAAAVTVALAAVAALSAAPAMASVDDALDLSAVDAFVQRELDAASVPGAALAITHGATVLQVRGFGVDSADRPVSGDTLFRVASLSKSFTALAVMQLVESGRVELDDTVASHLPDFRLADPRGASVTVEQLLDQTSGLTDADVSPFSREQPNDLREAVAALHDVRLSADPGARWSYHNPNYQVAARLVEVVSGQRFADYLRQHVFKPAGMTRSTTTDYYDDPVAGLAEGHVTAYGATFAASAPHVFTAGDGGVVTTATDLARWLVLQGDQGRSQTGAQLLSPQGVARMHTSNDPSGYALGWDTSGPPGAPSVVEHSGTVLTFSAQQALLPRSGYGVAVVFNSSSPMLGVETSILNGVIDILEGRTDSPPGRSYSQSTVDDVLAALSLVVLVLGVSGVLRSRRWAVARSSRLSIVTRLAPGLVVTALGVTFPTLLGLFLGGRDVTWTTAAYGWPALVVLVLCVLLAGTATIGARTWHVVRRTRSGVPRGLRPSA